MGCLQVRRGKVEQTALATNSIWQIKIFYYDYDINIMLQLYTALLIILLFYIGACT